MESTALHGLLKIQRKGTKKFSHSDSNLLHQVCSIHGMYLKGLCHQLRIILK
jgi:hypothetical protein